MASDGQMVHQLTAYEEDFLEDGIIAVCACGWTSRRCSNREHANREQRQHEIAGAPDAD
jgi:hypothetical protein